MINWFNENKLFLNWDKINHMIFGHQRKTDNVKITLDGVKKAKHLDVALDERLHWKTHTEYVKRKV